METKEYYSFLGHKISFEQTKKMQGYSIMIKLNGFRKREELFKNGECYSVYYFRSFDEDIAVIRNQYSGVNICILTVMEEQGGYTQYRSDTWEADGTYRNSRIDVYDSNDRQIYFGVLNPEGTDLISVLKVKYMDNGEELFNFHYNSDGTFKYCGLHSDIDYEDGTFHSGDIGDPNLDFTWEGNEYYQHAEPKIPGEIIV